MKLKVFHITNCLAQDRHSNFAITDYRFWFSIHGYAFGNIRAPRVMPYGMSTFDTSITRNGYEKT